ncbi:MAG: hypothetical protein JNK76_12335 [Planctomycetales bacterium]|nr:hypothetical protein [Planctomycetales bacterium]MBN8623889.1 hypothetical protein [Planctomycetota bacterium]
MKTFVMRVTLAALVCCLISNVAEAGVFRHRGSWHGNYYDPQWAGVPHAMVVPPTVHRQIDYTWGASGTRHSIISHQYGPSGRADGTFIGGPFQPQPVQPTDTNQFGTYYIRAPWK